MKVIWTNGCFDIIHVGHIKLFKYIKSLGDFVIVGVDTDERVKLLKGDNRPFNNLNDRIEVLSSIKYIDKIVVFNSGEELKSLIKSNDVNTLVVGSDYKNKPVLGSDLVNTVLFFDRFGDYSTTNILDKNSN